jgi:hypothetical protein
VGVFNGHEFSSSNEALYFTGYKMLNFIMRRIGGAHRYKRFEYMELDVITNKCLRAILIDETDRIISLWLFEM